ncbi:MAG: biotin--[acetyl-CoA-carboxylase] ligase [Candidatus Nanopelagicales bacterium]
MTDDPTGDPADLTPTLVSELLAASALPWRDVTVLDSTGSTNADLLAALADGAGEGTVIAAGEQTAGRGRQGREWASPPGTSLSFSVVLAPPADRAGFVPALTGIAVARAIRGLTDLDVSLKWPNDVLVGGGKVAGILAEGGPTGLVVGCGINVTVPVGELPVATATSLSAHGADVSRGRLLVTVLEQLHAANELWREAGYHVEGSGLLDAYRTLCATVGADVQVAMPDGSELVGHAEGIDDEGRLVLVTADGSRALTAGDVTHVRPA